MDGSANNSVNAIRPKDFREKVFFRKLRAQVDGSSKVEYALTQIRGIGIHFAQIVVQIANINPELRIGTLEQTDINRIEKIILNPEMNGVPIDVFNRRNDYKQGWNDHFVSNTLDITVKRDIDRKRHMKSFKGQKHSRSRSGLRERGKKKPKDE
ncbi:MAG: 30S ribosomal protein S13 [Promethearchaeota archaeon]